MRAKSWNKLTASGLPDHATLAPAVQIKVKPPVSPVKAHVSDAGHARAPAPLVSIDWVRVRVSKPGSWSFVSVRCSLKRYVKFKPLLVSQLGARQNVKPTKASAVTVAAVASTTPRISRCMVGVCGTKAPVMCRVSRASQGLPAMKWRTEGGVAYTGGLRVYTGLAW